MQNGPQKAKDPSSSSACRSITSFMSSPQLGCGFKTAEQKGRPKSPHSWKRRSSTSQQLKGFGKFLKKMSVFACRCSSGYTFTHFIYSNIEVENAPKRTTVLSSTNGWRSPLPCDVFIGVYNMGVCVCILICLYLGSVLISVTVDDDGWERPCSKIAIIV